MKTKKCSKCLTFKQITFFAKNSFSPDGLRSTCKKCHSETVKAYSKTERGKNVLRKASYKYKRTDKGLIAQREQARKMRIIHHDQSLARAAVGYAVASGKIVSAKERKCSYCGNPAIHYHHHNGYSHKNRLDVIPLCKNCHLKAR